MSCSEVWSLISKPSNVVANTLGVHEVQRKIDFPSKAQEKQAEEDYGVTVKLSSNNPSITTTRASITDEELNNMSEEELQKRVKRTKFKLFQRQVKLSRLKTLKVY